MAALPRGSAPDFRSKPAPPPRPRIATGFGAPFPPRPEYMVDIAEAAELVRTEDAAPVTARHALQHEREVFAAGLSA